MAVELMMGLPGSTVDTLRNDLQDCIGRDVRATVFPTVMLPNSPMNDPEYRREHAIVARPGEFVQQTSSYTRAEWDDMNRLALAFTMAENFNVLRQVGMYVRAETGMREIDFYERLAADARADRERWPVIALVFQSLPTLMVPPVSWALFCDEVHDYLVHELGIADDTALATVLEVQLAHLPARERDWPFETELTHDYVAWHTSVGDLRRSGHRDDWERSVRPLRELGPGRLRIDDPFGVCSEYLGGSTLSLSWTSSWDLDSPVGRPRQDPDAAERSAAPA
jgi:hypothetical protein